MSINVWRKIRKVFYNFRGTKMQDFVKDNSDLEITNTSIWERSIGTKERSPSLETWLNNFHIVEHEKCLNYSDGGKEYDPDKLHEWLKEIDIRLLILIADWKTAGIQTQEHQRCGPCARMTPKIMKRSTFFSSVQVLRKARHGFWSLYLP